MKVSDYIADAVYRSGIRHVFTVTGGGAMHLNDSLGKHPGLSCIFNHHEQASAMAAESYARLSNVPALVCVTSGPGGINALNGVFGAWTDSIPQLVISGQVKQETTVESTGLPLRQLGDQEFPGIIQCARTMTKYAVSVRDPKQIRYHLERALHLMRTGRPGPVWIDIPLDIQGSQIDPDTITTYDPVEDINETPLTVSDESLSLIWQHLSVATRPVVIVGAGIRASGTHTALLELLDHLQVPVVTAWNAHDVVHNEHPRYIGRPSILGDRAGNLAVQNADLLLILGSRLNIRQVSYSWLTFARAAFKIMVDIDPVEMAKPTLKVDLPIHADLASFLPRFTAKFMQLGRIETQVWTHWCLERRTRYPVVSEKHREKPSPINPYVFADTLTRRIPEDAIVVTGDGTACVTTFQAAYIKPKTRLYTNSGCASMGYDLPAAIGASIARQNAEVVCLAGDGSIQMNLQELQTIVHLQLPIKIYLLNNGGYHSIRQTQQNFFPAPLIGCTPESGVSFPEAERLAYAFQLPFFRCAEHNKLAPTIDNVMSQSGPVLCEVMLDSDQPFSPRASSMRLDDGRIVSRPLEDLAPFLPREELAGNMLIPYDNP